MEFTFPQYRKYPNGKSFFCISAADEFDEIKIMGSHYSVYHLKASILPDRNYIADMLEMAGDHWESCSKEEYESILADCKVNRKLLS